MIKPNFILFLMVALLVISVPAFAEDEKKDDPNALKATYSSGFSFATNDGNYKFKIGGRLFGDWLWGSADTQIEETYGSIVSGNEWRAAWLELSGELFESIEYRIWYDLAGGDADAKDVWIGFKGLPFGSLRFGHFKEPFSLEQITANKYTTFMERSLIDIFVPGRNTGIANFGATKDGKFTWGLGVFTEANTYGEAPRHDDNYNFSARVTSLPWTSGNDSLLHVGAAYHHVGLPEYGGIRYRQRPEAHLLDPLVDTNTIVSDGTYMFGLEGAFQVGRFSLQGEYIGVNVSSIKDYEFNFNGYYIYGSFFLTQDYRGYSKSSGAFGGVKPSNPFTTKAGGTGAWEVALRYSQLDLDDDEITGGILKDITLGINWYVNSNARIMWNIIRADREDLGALTLFQMRYQIHF